MTKSVIGKSKPSHLLLLLVIYVLFFFRLYRFVDLNCVNVLFWDQWDLLYDITLDNKPFYSSFFKQHGPHRQGLGGLIAALIYPLSDWNVRTEAFIGVIIVAIAALIAIAIKGKLLGKLHWTDAAIPIAFSTLLQFETFIGAPNLAHGPIPLLLVILTTWVLILKQPMWQAIFLVILQLFCTYTGFAVFSPLLVIPLLLLFWLKAETRHAKLWFGFAALVILLLFLSFLINYRHQPAAECFHFPHDQPIQYLEFVSFLFGYAWGAPSVPSYPQAYALILIYSGSLFTIFIVMMGIVAIRSRLIFDDKAIAILYLSAFSLVFMVFTAIGRVCFGKEAAFMSRYVLYIIPGIFAMYLFLQASLAHIGHKSLLKSFWSIFFILLITGKETTLTKHQPLIDWYRDGKMNWIECYIEQQSIDSCNQITNFKLYPEEGRIDGQLRYLQERNLSFFKE